MDKQYQRIIFGLKVKELRAANKLSFMELSKKAGMSVSYLNEIEKGKKYPKEEKLSNLAKALGVSVEELSSFDLNPSLLPAGELLRSNFLSELPLDLFGIELQKVVEIISRAPMRVGAFVSTLVELSKNYQLREDNFYFGAMRAYQELHFNFFEEIEERILQFRQWQHLETGQIDSGVLERILLQEYGCQVNRNGLSGYPELRPIHCILDTKGDTLLLQPDLDEAQLSLMLGREIGYRFLQLKERPHYAPYRNPKSFEPVLSNFKATYFATGLVMDKDEVAGKVRQFTASSTWDEEAFLEVVRAYNVSPEMFVHRLTNVIPKYFQLKQLFFIRVRTAPGEEEYMIDKVLHLGQSHHPHSNKIHEHYCRRLVSVEALQELRELRKQGGERIIARVQKARYHGTEDEYLTTTLAIPANHLQPKDISVTFGILMDDWLRNVVKYSHDPEIPRRIVNNTCERCPISDCAERAAAPTVYEQRLERKKRKEIVDRIVGL